jgi:hypothetical protein
MIVLLESLLTGELLVVVGVVLSWQADRIINKQKAWNSFMVKNYIILFNWE